MIFKCRNQNRHKNDRNSFWHHLPESMAQINSHRVYHPSPIELLSNTESGKDEIEDVVGGGLAGE